MTSRPTAVLLNREIMAVLHIFVWALLFVLPLFYNIGDFAKIDNVLIINWIPLFFNGLLFYLNYVFLIDNVLFKKKPRRWILWNILLIVVLMFLMTYSKNAAKEILGKSWPMEAAFIRWVIAKSIFSFIITIGISLAIKMTQKWLQSEREKVGIENQFLRTELSMLRYQIQPHFFFNSLNNIYSLIDIAPDRAKETVHGLGKLMRYLLYETATDKIDLEKEVIFLKNFIYLMEIRVSKKVTVTTNFPENVSGIQIAPLLFISMIENAFKHGVSSEFESEIIISMRLENQKLIFIVQNSYFPKDYTDKGGSGVGMENLRNRLEKIYPNQYVLHQNQADNYFTSTLTLTL